MHRDNEMILTFMMSQAQAESESLSSSVKWGHRKNFKDGKVYYHYASFLGYRKGPDGLPEIDPDEAAIVRRIFARYLMGQSAHQICRDLMSDGVKTAQGGDLGHDSVVEKCCKMRSTSAMPCSKRPSWRTSSSMSGGRTWGSCTNTAPKRHGSGRRQRRCRCDSGICGSQRSRPPQRSTLPQCRANRHKNRLHQP